eukprot:3493763-Pyramimonas_sp.AAC.1
MVIGVVSGAASFLPPSFLPMACLSCLSCRKMCVCIAWTVPSGVLARHLPPFLGYGPAAHGPVRRPGLPFARLVFLNYPVV